METFIL